MYHGTNALVIWNYFPCLRVWEREERGGGRSRNGGHRVSTDVRESDGVYTRPPDIIVVVDRKLRIRYTYRLCLKKDEVKKKKEEKKKEKKR